MVHTTGHFLITYAVALFAIANPFGAVAIFLSLTTTHTLKEQRRCALKVMLSVIIIFFITTWAGSTILRLFGITIGSFEIAGGIIILLYGLSMLEIGQAQGHRSYTNAEHSDSLHNNSIAIVPLAIPIIAGPGTLSTIIVSMRSAETFLDQLLLNLVATGIAIVVGLILYFGPALERLLSVSGIKIIQRIMGLILSAIASSMVLSGIKEMLPSMLKGLS